MFGISLQTIFTGLGTAAFAIVLSAVAQRNTWLASIVVALPLMTIFTVFLTAMNAGAAKANAFSNATFLLFWPGLAFFIVLNLAQRFGIPFWWAFAMSIVATALATWGCTAAYQHFGLIAADGKPVASQPGAAPPAP